MHVTAGPHDLEAAIEAQECLQQVLLVPEPAFFDRPVTRVLEGDEDVMHVYQHAIPNPRHDFKQLEVYVAPKLRHVAGIYEQDIVRPQFAESIERNLLHRRLNQLGQVLALRK